MDLYICIDVGGTFIKHGMVDAASSFAEIDEIPTEAHLGGASVVNRMMEIVKRYINQYKIAGICISSAGVVDCKKGEILYAGSSLPGYTGISVKKMMEEKFYLPCEIENDVNCAGLAEYFGGAAKGYSSMACLTVGTGIGGSVIIDDKIVHGCFGSAGEVGYMYMGEGTFEELASTRTLIQRVALRKKCEISDLDGKKIFKLAKNGDSICIHAIDEMTDILGKGIANICFTVNPEVVVLGGGIMSQREYLYGKIRKCMDYYLHSLPQIAEHTKLAFAKHKNYSGMLGAYYHFRKMHGQQF